MLDKITHGVHSYAVVLHLSLLFIINSNYNLKMYILIDECSSAFKLCHTYVSKKDSSYLLDLY